MGDVKKVMKKKSERERKTSTSLSLKRLCRNEGKGPSFRRKPESREFEKE
jgi:hypothetical protein